MKAIEILADEHHLIKQFLNLLDNSADRLLQGKSVQVDFFKEAIHFYHDFTDKFHHYKEELVLFAFLAQKKEGEIDGEIEKLRSQHEHGRNNMNAIEESLSSYDRRIEPSERTIHRNLTDYVTRLRAHIEEEEKVFFPMVRRSISDEEHELVLQQYSRYEDKSKLGGMNEGRKILEGMEDALAG